MCKLHNINNKAFHVYYIPSENYVGVTTNIHKRMLKHKNRSGFDTSGNIVLCSFINLNDALSFEAEMQKFYGCKKGVRNQEGSKNPYAKMCLNLETGIYYDTLKDLSEAYGFNYSLVRSIVSLDREHKRIKVKRI